MNILPFTGLIAFCMIVFAYFLSRWQVGRLIHPINTLDLETPLDNEIYEELTPLLQRIDQQCLISFGIVVILMIFMLLIEEIIW